MRAASSIVSGLVYLVAEPPKDSKEQELRDNIKQLEVAISHCEKLGESGKGAKAELEIKLEAVRRELHQTKPRLTQHTHAGHRLASAKGKKQRLEHHIEEQLRFIASAQEQIDGMRAQVAATDREIELLNRDLIRTLPGMPVVDLEVDPEVLAATSEQAQIKEMLQSDTFKKFAELLAASQAGLSVLSRLSRGLPPESGMTFFREGLTGLLGPCSSGSARQSKVKKVEGPEGRFNMWFKDEALWKFTEVAGRLLAAAAAVAATAGGKQAHAPFSFELSSSSQLQARLLFGRRGEAAAGPPVGPAQPPRRAGCLAPTARPSPPVGQCQRGRCLPSAQPGLWRARRQARGPRLTSRTRPRPRPAAVLLWSLPAPPCGPAQRRREARAARTWRSSTPAGTASLWSRSSGPASRS
ncbi:unnamed protein product [Prorocentrum cordatum]|uniref:Uncharacterized protein n=1 Tax=Prorocentrum cordatum TaxID=2364126 RepID=A0ABN9QL85_9DINO|nr:unnamed protein product [Polarella glacialis]